MMIILATINQECQIQRVRVDTSKFTLDVYPIVPAATVEPIFDSDNFDIPDDDMTTGVNYLSVGTLHDHFSHDPDNIAVNAVAVDNDYSNAIHGQFDSGANATVRNLHIYLHDYR